MYERDESSPTRSLIDAVCNRESRRYNYVHRKKLILNQDRYFHIGESTLCGIIYYYYFNPRLLLHNFAMISYYT